MSTVELLLAVLVIVHAVNMTTIAVLIFRWMRYR